MKKNKVCYQEEDMINAMREVYFLLFSFRDIFDKMAYDEKFDYKDAFAKLSIDEKILDRLANIRDILESQFHNHPKTGDYTFLEKVYEDIKLWKVHEKCIQEKN